MDNGSYFLTSLSMTDLTIREHHMCSFFIHNSTIDNWIFLSDRVFIVQAHDAQALANALPSALTWKDPTHPHRSNCKHHPMLILTELFKWKITMRDLI
ncbi:hypothetical protein ACB092_01G227100 [Castanea dentata]